MSTAFAADLTLSPAKIEVGQSTRLTLIVVGQATVTPEIPAPDSVRVQYTDQKQTFGSRPGQSIRRETHYGYRVTGLEAGSFVLGPAWVEVAGVQESTGPANIEVIARRDRPTGDRLITTTAFTEQEIWEGQVVSYETVLTARHTVQEVSWNLPPFEGLQRAPHDEEHRTRERIEDEEGDLTVLRMRVPVVATGTGDRTQPPATGRVALLTNQRTLGIGPRRQTRTVVGQRAPLIVKPLPPAPADFSGLVGTFTLQSELGVQGSVGVGESVPWTVRVAGSGVVDGFTLSVPQIPGVELYPSGEDVVGRTLDGAYLAQKTFRRVLVPTEGGRIEVPALSVRYFDTDLGNYATLATEAGLLDVAGTGVAAEVEAYEDGRDRVEATPVKVAGLYTVGSAWTPPLSPLTAIAAALLALPGVFLLWFDGWRTGRRWLLSRPHREPSGPRGKERLRDLPQDTDARHRVLDLALREALAERVGVPVSKLDRDAALCTLERADDVRHAFSLLDGVRFGGDPARDMLGPVVAALEAL